MSDLRRNQKSSWLRSASVAVLASVPMSVPGQTAAPDAKDDYQFANGIAAIVESKIITVEDIRRDIAPLVPEIRRDSKNEQEFNQKLEAAQDEIIQGIIDRELIVKEFRKDEKKRIPESYVDNEVAETQITQFEGDRSKFLAYLRGRGQTLRDYRREVEENIIFGYMRQQQRKSQSTVSPVKIETFYNENKDRFFQEDQAHMRLIQFTRKQGQTDAELRALAQAALDRIHSGEKFEDVARDVSQESRRAKGGDWDWQKRSDLRPEFSDPLFSLKKGETSGIIVTPEGAFLLHVDDRKYAGIQPIDEVREQIERILIQQSARASQERWLERLRRNGYVKHF
ncbi:MAG: peptidyl-prolyl cis-trans isomerase [Opitutaceae bacterium]|nr:peptidyl-prolyl cis-trans isomerase [Opitutaceae bacterium]